MSENQAFDNTVDLLLVDDRPENLLTLEAVLTQPGYNLIMVNSGDKALRYLLDHEPALILMDVQMPNLDGFETATIIKRSERTREIPIIFITAISKDDGFVLTGYDHGAVDYIYKPYDARILKSKVAVFADLSRKTRRLLHAEQALRKNERQERERQLAELELLGLRREQADQKKYRDLVEGIDHGIVWSANPATHIVSFVSPSAEKIVGYSPEQWTREKDFLVNHVHPSDRTLIVEGIRKAQTEGGDVSLEHRFVAADKRVVWLHTGIRVAKSADGLSAEIRGLSIDITRSKDAELILRQNKQRSDFLAEASMLLSESLDYETTLSRLGMLAVPRLADWYSVCVLAAPGELNFVSVAHVDPAKIKLAQDHARKYPPDPNQNFGAPNVLRTGVSELYAEISDELLIKRAHDKNHLRELKRLGFKSAMVVPLISRGKVLGAMTLVTAESGYIYSQDDLQTAEDLARRAASAIDNSNLYKDAQKAIQARDEFLSIASHELKTPLTPLKLQTQSLMRLLTTTKLAEVKPERISRMLESSDRQLARLSRLIDDLLDISRISAGKLELTVENFELMELVKEVAERFSSQLKGAGCELSVESSTSIKVNWDRFRVEQVLINLLTNAMKYGPGKPIVISARVDDERVKISVRDQGIGIGANDLDRIFGKFERAVSGNHFGGLGLGLYIVTQILEAHRGTISVQSEVGVGSTFTIDLPQSFSSSDTSSRCLPAEFNSDRSQQIQAI